jgi:hypothetical protein
LNKLFTGGKYKEILCRLILNWDIWQHLLLKGQAIFPFHVNLVLKHLVYFVNIYDSDVLFVELSGNAKPNKIPLFNAHQSTWKTGIQIGTQSSSYVFEKVPPTDGIASKAPAIK